MTKPATILIIEDQAAEARFFQQSLTQAGYEVLGMAASGEEAIGLALKGIPDLVLADIAIKGEVDGIEVSQIISAQTGAGIVYLSGHSDADLLEKAKITEPFGYLVKPIEFRELISTVAMALYKREAQRRLVESEELLKQANEELERRVMERTRELFEANRKLQEEIEVRKGIEASLKESEERFRTILDLSGDSMFVKDQSRVYTMVNTAMAEMLGRQPEDIIGKRSEDFFTEDDASHIREIDLRVLNGERIEEERTRRIDATDLKFLDTCFPLVQGERIDGICGVSRNITDRRLGTEIPLPHEDDVVSEAMRNALDDALNAARTDGTVLITGESGTGKDWVARYIHAHSRRSAWSFSSINCAALPSDLAESELFGHESGAFTGARGRKRGLLELAEGGTLLLNEIGEMDLRLQAKGPFQNNSCNLTSRLL
ncbi:MAG: sigma 54-interacting transcriptional regulator [Deltaproteobacteria bacterium]|nr:sigma 54-interacting transcriptional regulator [Deltaproteobacteria bacterium]